DARGLALQIPQVEEAVAADTAAGDDVNPFIAGAVERKDALNTYPIRDFADGEGGAIGSLRLTDDHALEGLDALLFTFLHLPVHPHGVTGAKVGNVLPKLLRLDVFQGAEAHGC